MNEFVGYEFGISPLAMRRFKYYTRNGKQHIRDYKREMKGGMNIMDLQQELNKSMAWRMTNDFVTKIYTNTSE